MAKERARKQAASGIRLLILFFLFSLHPGLIYAGIEKDPELSFSSGPLFIDSVFEIKIKLDEYSSRSSDEPKLIILDENSVLEFLDSSINSLYGGILITNRYKLKKIGNFELIPYLSLGKHQTKLKKFSIQVEPPALSKDTMFKWKILDAVSYSPVKKIIQGKKYLIVLMGFFYDYFQTEGRTSGLDINCQAPEDSIFEAAVRIKESDTSKIERTIIDETGWKAVSYFFWTPLKAGDIGLPVAQISIASESKDSRKIYVREQRVNVIKGSLKQEEISDDEKKAYETLGPALNTKKNELGQTKLKNHKENFEEKKERALLIAELRTKEAGSFFPGKIKNQRLEYEKELNLKESFAVRSAILKKILWFLFFILLLLSSYFFLYKKKNIVFKLFLILSLGLISVLIFLYSRQYERAVYRPLNYDEPYLLYHIPETSGTIVSSLEIGETVIIKQKTSEWFFIEKKDGTGGWQKKERLYYNGLGRWEVYMSKNFGDILDEWDKITGKPYGKKQIKKDEHLNKKNHKTIIKEDNSKKINPMEMWLRRYGVEDKDAQEEFTSVDYARQRKTLREMHCEDEIDLHGMTCDEAEAALNVFFENSIRHGLKKILIIHGKGNHSGGGAVLAPFVRSYLEKHKRAGECGHPKNADGGTGSTWVILK